MNLHEENIENAIAFAKEKVSELVTDLEEKYGCVVEALEIRTAAIRCMSPDAGVLGKKPITGLYLEIRPLRSGYVITVGER